MSKLKLLMILTGLLTAGVNAAAQENLRLEHRAEQTEKFIDENGVEQVRLVEAGRVLPGEPVIFTVTYTNSGDEPAESITITNPVPEHMIYVDNSAAGDGASIAYSVDGGKSFDAPQNLALTNKEGTLRRATAADFTHVRWVIGSDVAPGDSGEVKFTAVVE
ncbi:MAG: hypothetical protein ACN4GT_05310 [Gammaproteobacteria bacterium]